MTPERPHLWYNARIWRNQEQPADAVLVANGRILAVGTEAELRAGQDIENQTDLGGAWLYPGFRDPHAHLLYLGLATFQADLNGCSGPEQVLDRLLAFSERGTGSSDWIAGRDWNDIHWPAGTALTRDLLDQVFPDRPVYLTRVDRHAAVVNSEALRRAGIDRDIQVKGGRIGVHNGKPSGLLVDEAMTLVSRLIPEPGPEVERESLLRAQRLCFSEGLTGVADMGLNMQQYRVLLAAQQEGVLKIPVYGTLTPDAETEAHYRREGPYFGERLTLRAFKYYADGALGSRGARLLTPYSDAAGHRGLWMHKPDYLHHQAELNAAQGFQTVTHAIGDAAVRLALDVVEKALPPEDHRWRVEHAQIVHPEDLPRFARLGTWASVQSCHGISDRKMAMLRLGERRLAHAYRSRSLLDAGARLVNGTDFPIEPVSALRSFVSACRRTGLDVSGEVPFRPEEALTRTEALLAMTAWAAEAQFQEADTGRIAPGYYADFTVLDTDLMNAAPESLVKTRVLSTVVRGETVFSAD